MSDVAHDNCKRTRLCTGILNKYLIAETSALNVLTQRLKTMGCNSCYQSDIVSMYQGNMSLVCVESYKAFVLSFNSQFLVLWVDSNIVEKTLTFNIVFEGSVI